MAPKRKAAEAAAAAVAPPPAKKIKGAAAAAGKKIKIPPAMKTTLPNKGKVINGPASKVAPRRKAADATAPAQAKNTKLPKKSKVTKEPPPKKATKRKAADEVEAAPPAKKTKTKAAAAPAAKKIKPLKKGKVINEPPSQRLNVYVFGEGSSGELGLGTAKNAVDVKRPRLNPNLAADTIGVVQAEAGGMHAIALTHDNKILTWGVNDQGALGRDTKWEGGLRDMDAADDDSDDEDNDNGLNPRESMPGEVDWSQTELAPGTRFVSVVAGDSCSLALTDDGKVYGWGTFRGNDGIQGFTEDIKIATHPILIEGLKNITSIKAGQNHCIALDTRGAVFAWGNGQHR